MPLHLLVITAQSPALAVWSPVVFAAAPGGCWQLHLSQAMGVAAAPLVLLSNCGIPVSGLPAVLHVSLRGSSSAPGLGPLPAAAAEAMSARASNAVTLLAHVVGGGGGGGGGAAAAASEAAAPPPLSLLVFATESAAAAKQLLGSWRAAGGGGAVAPSSAPRGAGSLLAALGRRLGSLLSASSVYDGHGGGKTAAPLPPPAPPPPPPLPPTVPSPSPREGWEVETEKACALLDKGVLPLPLKHLLRQFRSKPELCLERPARVFALLVLASLAAEKLSILQTHQPIDMTILCTTGEVPTLAQPA